MRFLVLFLALIISSCAFDPTIEYKVDDELESIVDDFFQEASIRGWIIEKKNLIVRLDDIKEHGLCYCNNEKEQKTIVINRKVVNENINVSDIHYNFVRLIVFHELGHWIGMNHRGPQKSIMNSSPSLGGCDCGDFIMMTRYANESSENQKKIIDELFGISR